MLVTAEACERNKAPILEVLRTEFATSRSVLEIGSGTGQHAVHFAAHLPHLSWQPSEVAALLPALAERVRLEGSPNLRSPIALDVRATPWPHAEADAIFSANTLHIMGWEEVEDFFRGVGAALGPGGVLCVYGPFNYQGRYTSASNAEFDRYLRARDPASGIRDFEEVNTLSSQNGLSLLADHAMPANNQLIIWHKRALSSQTITP